MFSSFRKKGQCQCEESPFSNQSPTLFQHFLFYKKYFNPVLIAKLEEVNPLFINVGGSSNISIKVKRRRTKKDNQLQK